MHPEIQETLQKTVAWLKEKHFAHYAALDDVAAQALMRSAATKALDEAINVAALAEDVAGTKAACRAYLKHWREVLKAEETRSKEQKTVVE